MLYKLVLSLFSALLLALCLSPVTLAQDDDEGDPQPNLRILISRDYFVINVINTDSLDMSPLLLRALRRDNIADRRVIDDFDEFALSTLLDEGDCIVYISPGTNPTIPSQCSHFFRFPETMLAGDVFWIDLNRNDAITVGVLEVTPSAGISDLGNPSSAGTCGLNPQNPNMPVDCEMYCRACAGDAPQPPPIETPEVIPTEEVDPPEPIVCDQPTVTIPEGMYPLNSRIHQAANNASIIIDDISTSRDPVDYGYEIDQQEVSRQCFHAYLVETSQATPPRWNALLTPENADLPMVFVTPAEAQAYCQHRGGDLPTAGEWEVAAGWNALMSDFPQAGIYPDLFPWGSAPPNDTIQPRLNFGSSLLPVDDPNFSVGELGLVHIIGNVAEWVQSEMYAGEPWYLAYGSGINRGSPQYAGVLYEMYAGTNLSQPNIGFRCTYR